jgi:hypothetical protein
MKRGDAMPDMGDRVTPDKFAHLVIRVICLLTATDFALGTFYKPYFNLLHGLAGKVLFGWDIVSPELLLAIVLIRTARADAHRQPGNRIDLIIVSLWFLFFWGAIYYAFSHTAII